jgi:folate-binding protein YgfZ
MSQILPDFHVWRPATWLHVAGPDAFAFLQGQFSNDLRALEQVESVYGLWLNQKGRVLADSFVVKAGEPGAFWVGSYFSPVAIVRERLESHLIADDVQIDDQTDRWHGLTTFDAAAPADGGGMISFPGRRGESPAREWLMRREPDQRQGKPLAAEEMEARRIAAGIPAVPLDLGPSDLPQEGGLEVGAVSFNKGCYLGQEVMARLQSMGTPRRRLFRVTGQGSMFPAGTPLQQEGRVVGEMRSATATAHGFIGLAMLQLSHLNPEQPLTAAGIGQSIRVTAPV